MPLQIEETFSNYTAYLTGHWNIMAYTQGKEHDVTSCPSIQSFIYGEIYWLFEYETHISELVWSKINGTLCNFSVHMGATYL